MLPATHFPARQTYCNKNGGRNLSKMLHSLPSIVICLAEDEGGAVELEGDGAIVVDEAVVGMILEV